MVLKRGSGKHKIIIITTIILVTMIFLIAKPRTSGLVIYNIGTFDSSSALSNWSENEANSDGDFIDNSVDTQTYYSGGGSLRGATIYGAGRNWNGEYLYQTLPINSPAGNNRVYANFNWRKSYEGTMSETNSMYIIIEKPDGTKPTIWQNNGLEYNNWNQESIDITNQFNQNGEYKIRLHCNLKNYDNATNNSRPICWYDEFKIDIQNSSSGAPNFYSQYESPINNTDYSPATTYTFQTSVTNTDGTVWVELDGTNRSTTAITGSTYKYATANLTSGIHKYYYWTWSSGTQRIRNSSEMRYYNVNKPSGEVRTVINGFRGSLESLNNSMICLAVNAPEYADGKRTLLVNGQIYGGSDYNFQNCTILKQKGLYNIKGYWDGGTNYQEDLEEWTLKISEEQEAYLRQKPLIKIITPENKTYPEGTTSIELAIESSIELKECKYSIDGKEAEIMNKTNATSFKNEAQISNALMHEVFFICKDNFGNSYSIQPIVEFSIEKKKKTTSNETIEEAEINETIKSCSPVLKCGGWSECTAVYYDITDIIRGKVNVTGERRRVCYDTQLCQNAKIEREYCSLAIPIKAERKEWCGEQYLELYEANNKKLVSRLKQSTGAIKKIDVGFIIEGFAEYCNYCYNEKRDYDEEGIDCGGPNCPSCQQTKRTITRNQINIILRIIEVIIITAILTYLFHWLLLRTNEKETTETEEALRVVREALNKGYSREQIRELFRRRGWADYDIDEIFKKI